MKTRFAPSNRRTLRFSVHARSFASESWVHSINWYSSVVLIVRNDWLLLRRRLPCALVSKSLGLLASRPWCILCLHEWRHARYSYARQAPEVGHKIIRQEIQTNWQSRKITRIQSVPVSDLHVTRCTLFWPVPYFKVQTILENFMCPSDLQYEHLGNCVTAHIVGAALQ